MRILVGEDEQATATFLAVWEAQSFDDLAVAPPGTAQKQRGWQRFDLS